MALSDLNIGTSLPGGYLNTLGGSVDPFYAQADGSWWPSLAAACAAVPTAYRRLRTVNVLGREYQWLTDLSNEGLLPKAGGVTTVSSAHVVSFSPTQVQFQLSPDLAAGGLANLRYELVPRTDTNPPSSYAYTLDATNSQFEGVVWAPDSVQKLEVESVPGATGGTVVLTLLDSSDQSLSYADVSYSRAGTWFRFTRANGTTYEGLFASIDMAFSA